jgi:two-component system cell cycle sensor histidine kinase/response regulator CckA
MNMAINAREAMPGGGTLTLETARVSFDQGSEGRYPGLRPGEYVMLAITDTGAGMSAGTRARVFEPFFSTKGVGQGTGLGLSTCYGIVRQSGGQIIVDSEPGRGTTFTVFLPRVEHQTPLPVERPDAPDLPRGTETVLLVEEDPTLCEMTATLLGRLGYTVLAAVSNIEALGLKQRRDVGHIDVLFIDVATTPATGKELSEHLRALDPRTRILFASEYTEHSLVHQDALSEGVALLQRPFTPGALARRLREVLDHSHAPKPTLVER